MNTQDFNNFSEAWADAHEVMASGKVLTARAMESIFYDLEDYALQSVLAAIKYHRKTAKFAPTAYDIIALLNTRDKRMTADEAWVMMPKDEFETVVWTQEMAEAYSIAYDLIIDGDKIAARMAFKGAYERLCSEAVMMQRPVKWIACLGYDKARIEPALMKAVAAGRLTQESANKLLPAPTDSGPIAGLLAGKVTELPANNENLRARWGELSEALSAGQRKLAEEEKQRVIEAENKRFEFEKKRQEGIDRVDARLQATAISH